MSLFLLAATAAHAAPTATACQSWASKLKGAANATLAGLSELDDPRMKKLRGQIFPGPVFAKVSGGVCRIQTVATANLEATLAVPAAGGRSALTCPMEVRQAMVPLVIEIGGTDAAPRVASSTLPVEGLAPFMTTCVKADWVQKAVVGLAASWVREQKPSWHRGLETWLAQ